MKAQFCIAAAGVAAFAACLAGCEKGAARPLAPSLPSARLFFEDTAPRAGIDFALGNSARPLTILETAPGGAGFLDYDGDGRLDALLVGPRKVGLFRNLGAGRFQNVTDTSGLSTGGYWMGCAAADYDGDGRTDLLLTGYDRTALYRNTGGRFEDVTRRAGLDGGGWSLTGAFGDYDCDGRIDLYVTRYLHFGPKTLRLCRNGTIADACGPEVYDPQFGILYRNLGGGRFEDVTRSAGAAPSAGKSWAALFSDFDGDRYPELYVANDMTPCDFYLNQKGRFRGLGSQSNVAYDASGHLQGAMGCDSGDYDNDGRLDLVVTTYFAQPTSLYRNDGDGLFTEVGTPAGIGARTMPYVGFGTGLVDFDNDGWLDFFQANGQVRANISRHDPSQQYAQPLQLFRNNGGRFHEVSATAGEPFHTPVVGRGAAFGDYDADGRVDILLSNLEGKALLLRNVSEPANHWLRVSLAGSGGNRQGLGARVELQAGDLRLVREVRTCGSVLSANEPVAHFGLGSASAVDRVTVRWADGRTTTRTGVPVDQVLRLSPAAKD